MLSRENAVLVIIDIQEVLLPKSEEVAAAYLENAVKLVRAAKVLGLPILVTEQNPARLGETHPAVLPELEGLDRIPKMEFGCMGNDAFRSALEETARNQLLIVGMEAHVCVCQTALAAIEAGYEAYVVGDAVVASSKREYKAGMRRMENAGAVPVSTQMAIFELLERAGTPEFKAMLPLLK